MALESNEATVVTDTSTTENVENVNDTTNNENKQNATEELYEVPVGKDSSGKPIIKKFSKSDLIKHAGLGLSAHERFEQVKAERAKVEALVKAMKDPERILEVAKALGHNVDELIQREVEKAIAEAQEDPKDKELRITKAQLDRFLKEEAARKKAAEEAQIQEQTQIYTKKLTEKIDGALKDAKLPNTPANRAAVAKVLEDLWQSTDESGSQLFANPLEIPSDKVVAYLKKNRVGGLASLIEGADEESILEILPEDVLNKIGKALTKKLSKAQGKVDNTIQNTNASESVNKKNERKVQTTAELDAEIKERVRKAQIAWERQHGKRV